MCFKSNIQIFNYEIKLKQRERFDDIFEVWTFKYFLEN